MMMQPLEVIFGELGIVQYLGEFVDQGFDTWETILDITESDLDALGVKLGHRRKLQRRIAKARGVAPDVSLVSPTQPNLDDTKPSPDVHKPDVLIKSEPRETINIIVTKRKYRRHPKPDENAPERPPSAYVLFSNKMRDDLRGRNLTFTEIAKLVGENWQSLSPAEKETYESQAQALKDKYQSDLAEYKKTQSFRDYQDYLQEFKSKHSVASQDKDAAKRVKLSSPAAMSGIGANAPARSSRSGSVAGSQAGSELPPSRQQRLNSTVSVTDSAASMTPASYHASLDEPANSPMGHQMERQQSSERRSPARSTPARDPPSMPVQRDPVWMDEQRAEQPNLRRTLPSLSDVLDGQALHGSMSPANETPGFPFPRSHHSNSPGPAPSLLNGDVRPPQYRNEPSTGSSSSSSTYSYPRTPLDGPLPIHALLSSKPASPYYESQPAQNHPYHSPSAVTDQTPPYGNQVPAGLDHYRMTNGYRSEPNTSHAHVPVHSMHYGYGAPHCVQPSSAAAPAQSQSQSQGRETHASLDGMSALLKAGEIVDRRAQ